MPQNKAKSNKNLKCVFCLKQNVELFIVPEYSRSDFGGFVVDVERDFEDDKFCLECIFSARILGRFMNKSLSAATKSNKSCCLCPEETIAELSSKEVKKRLLSSEMLKNPNTTKEYNICLMCLHLIDLLAGFRSHSKRIQMASKSEINSSGSILDDILPNFDSPKPKSIKKSTKKFSSEFEKILLKKLILPEAVYSNEKFTKLICSVNLSSKAIPTPRSILRIKRRRSDHIPMERTPKRVKLDVSDNSTEKKSRWNVVESTDEEDDDSNDDDYNKSDAKKHKKSPKKSMKKIKEEISKKRATRNLIKIDSSSDEEVVKSPRKLVSPIMFKGVNSSDEDPVADNKFKKMMKRRQSIHSPEKTNLKVKKSSVSPKKISKEDESKKSNGQQKTTKKKTPAKPEINKKALTKTYGKKFFQCKVNLDCSSKEDEDEGLEEEEEESQKEEEIVENENKEKEKEKVIEKMETDKQIKAPTPAIEKIISSDDDSLFGDSKRPKTPVRRNSKSPSPFSKLLAESKKEKEILPPIVLTEEDLSQTEISEATTNSDIETLNKVVLLSSNGDVKSSDDHSSSAYLNCFESSQEDINLSKTLLANEVEQLISDLEPKE